MATYEQLPSRAYPSRAFPSRMLAHGGVVGGVYPDSEQRPKRAYPLGSHPLHHLARLTTGGGLGLTYPDSEQRPKRGYPLGSHPLRHLARANGSTPVPPTPTPGSGGVTHGRPDFRYSRDGLEDLREPSRRSRHEQQDMEAIMLAAHAFLHLINDE